jgi:UDP-2,4-diacetamido-2,4,6-trideoxy-beta-L-altropyranose hydrolase
VSGRHGAEPRANRTAIIVQARYGSTRLPGKVLKLLAGKTVLEHVLTRCRSVAGVDAVVCATTDKPADDPIAAEAARLGVTVFRGDESDVLDRYLGAARLVEADIIMRVTSDCPLIDPAVCAAVLALRAATGADYASNNMPRLFPHGLDCEAFTRHGLELAAASATDPYDREHVTPWLRRQPELKRANLTGPGWPANTHRWTLDYPEDFTFFDAVFQAAEATQLADMQAILSLLGARPDLSAINATHAVATARGTRDAIVFRFDADQEIGTGHAMRCATLSNRCEELGWPCFWAVTQRTAAFLGSRLPAHQAIILTGATTAEQLAQIAAEAGPIANMVLDHYALPAGFDTAARQIARRIIWIDDFADRPLDADLVVNSTPGIDSATYQKLLPPAAKIMIGGLAAPLRRQFAVARAAINRPAGAGIRRALISFGGVDPLDGTSLAIAACAQALPDCQIDVVLGGNAPHLDHVQVVMKDAEKAGRSIRLLRDVADMAGLMATADLSIGAPGTTTWERCCLGQPSLLIGIAENQRRNAAIISQAGAAIVCGFLTTEPRDQVLRRMTAALQNLAGDPAELARMSAIASGLSDGRGIDRIIVNAQPAITLADGQQLGIRLAEASDEDLLLRWQRAPETRRFALNPQVPTPDRHHAWFQAKLQSAADLFLIAEVAGEAVGYVRLDWRGDNRGSPMYLISIATAPGHYRRGIGQALLRQARQLAPGATLIAQILPENLASLGLFGGLGYQLRPDGFFWSVPAS